MVEALAVDGVTTRYGKQVVLEGVSLTVAEGEVFGLIGLNGVGKTTLIKSILTLVRPAVGTVRIFDRNHRDPLSRAKLAYLPEKFQPSNLLTGAEFIRFGLSFYGRSFERSRAREVAEGLELDPAALDRRVGTYSMGMVQKLGLLATLMTERPLLIMDDPLAGLDPRARTVLKKHILAYRQRGNTVFLSSHILAELDEVCDRIGILHAGRLAYEGTAAELKNREGSPSLERSFLGVIEGSEQAAS